MAELTISDVVQHTGLASSALRFYERQQLLTSVGRVGGRRVYEPSVIERLAFIDLCQSAGFTIREIGALLANAPDHGWRVVAEGRLTELDDQIEAAQRARSTLQHLLRCRHRTLEGCPVIQDAVERHSQIRFGRLS